MSANVALPEMDLTLMKMTALILAASASCLWLPATSATAFAKDAAASDDADSEDNKIRCRKLPVTGSLVKKTKVCRTVAEWRSISEKGNRNARDIIESGNACAGGPMCTGG